MKTHPEPSGKQVRASPPTLRPLHEVPPALLSGGNTEVVCEPAGEHVTRGVAGAGTNIQCAVGSGTADSSKGGAGGRWGEGRTPRHTFPFSVSGITANLGQTSPKE